MTEPEAKSVKVDHVAAFVDAMTTGSTRQIGFLQDVTPDEMVELMELWQAVDEAERVSRQWAVDHLYRKVTEGIFLQKFDPEQLEKIQAAWVGDDDMITVLNRLDLVFDGIPIDIGRLAYIADLLHEIPGVTFR